MDWVDWISVRESFDFEMSIMGLNPVVPEIYHLKLTLLHPWPKHKIPLLRVTRHNCPFKGHYVTCRGLSSEFHIVTTHQYWNNAVRLGSGLGCPEAVPQMLSFELFGIVARFVVSAAIMCVVAEDCNTWH